MIALLAIPLIYLAYRSFVLNFIGKHLSILCDQANNGDIPGDQIPRKANFWIVVHWSAFVIMILGVFLCVLLSFFC